MKRSTRRRVARLVAVAGIAVVGVYLLQSFPREVSIRFALGPDHEVVTQARIAYLDEESGEAIKGVRLEYPEGAPKTFRHQVDLPPGRYDVRAELRGPSLSRSITRSLEVPADGLVHMDLFDQAYARAGAGGLR